MQVADFLSAGDVVRLALPDKARVLRALAQHAADRLAGDSAAIAQALTEREALGSTGIGSGIALPHARLAAIANPYGLFAALARPIAFGAVDDRPVDLVLMLLLPAHRPDDHLKGLACAARRLREPGLADALRAAAQPSRLHELLVGR